MSERSPLFGPLPEHGIWTAISLTRTQFLLILGLSLTLFLLVDGPVWQHLHDSHFRRIVLSYLIIPPAVVVGLVRNRAAGALSVLVASVVLALLKLVLTAGLLVVLALGR